MKEKNELLKTIIYPIIVFLLIIIVWVISSLIINNEFVIPDPLLTIKELLVLLKTSELWSSYFSTIIRTILTFSISFVLSILLSCISYLNKAVNRILSIIVSILRSIPTISIILLLVIWTGSRTTPIIVALLITLPSLYSSYIDGMNNINKDILDLAKLEGANKFIIAIKFLTPLSTSINIQSISSSMSLNLKLIIAAEVLASTVRSLGSMMQLYRNYFETAKLIGITILTIVTAFILERVIKAILMKLFPQDIY